jgi:Mce-associated membrane protein
MNLVLYVVALVTAAACLVVSVAVVRAVRDDGGSVTGAFAEEQERYDAVAQAASEFTTALLNLRYDDFESSTQKVKALATGEFAEQYQKSTGGLLELIRRSKSVMTGEVVWAGVVRADEDSATVIVATSGTVSNAESDNEPVARTFRLQVGLTRVEDDWLASDLTFVDELA